MTLNEIWKKQELGTSFGNYLQFAQGKWSVIRLNRFEKFLRWIGIWYGSTTLQHIARQINIEENVNPALRAKIVRLWKKTYPQSLNPIDSSDPYQALPDDLKRLLPEYLGFAEAVAKLPTLDRRHKALFENKGFLFTEVRLPLASVVKLYKNIGRYPVLKDLSIYFRKWLFGCDFKDTQAMDLKLATRNPHCAISRLAISEPLYSTSNEPMYSLFFANLLEATPRVKALKFSSENSMQGQLQGSFNGGQGSVYGAMEYKPLRESAKNVLKNLTTLEVDDFKINSHELVTLLQTSQNFTSISLKTMRMTNVILTEIVRHEKLVHLAIMPVATAPGPGVEEVDYQILTRFRCLESFTPPTNLSKDLLIATILANFQLVKLDLTYYFGADEAEISPGIYLGEVLKILAEKRPNFQFLSVPTDAKVTDEELIPFVRSCPHLQTLFLKNFNGVSQEVLDELANCRELIDLHFHWTGSTAPDVDALISIPTLKSLSYYSGGFTILDVAKLRKEAHQRRLAVSSSRNGRSASSVPSLSLDQRS